MKRRNMLRIGMVVSLTAALACLFVALVPEKSGIRIPVHCANGKIGFIDDKGRLVLAAKWDEATPFTDAGVCYVSSRGSSWKFNYDFKGYVPKFWISKNRGEYYWKMDRLGKLSSYLRYNTHISSPRSSEPDSYGMRMEKDARSVRWINASGSPAFPGEWDDGIHFRNDDPAAVRKNGKWGFINRKGEAVTPFEWAQTSGFDGKGLACVSVNNKWGVINTKGDLVVPLYFNYLAGFDLQGMCAAHLNSGAGFIDPTGKIIIPFRYVRAGNFDRFDMANVMMWDDNNKLRFGWIDRTGKQVIPCIYHDQIPEWVWRFRDHELQAVCDDKGYGVIDRKGNILARSGGAALAHVEDPMAPGRLWITRVPDRGGSKPENGAFEPACYDQSGILIWRGNSWTRAQMATGLALFFGAISTLLWIMMRRKSAIDPAP